MGHMIYADLNGQNAKSLGKENWENSKEPGRETIGDNKKGENKKKNCKL